MAAPALPALSWDSQNNSEQSRYPVLSRSITVLRIRSTRNNKWSSPLKVFVTNAVEFFFLIGIKNRRPWCEGPGYSEENDTDWSKATDKEQADFDESDNDEVKK